MHVSAQGGNQYSPNGVKVMIFNLTGDQWLDPSTLRVVYQLNNAGNIGAAEGATLKRIEPLSWNPAVFFRRARISCGGVVVEDIDNFNRLSLMLSAIKKPKRNKNKHCWRRFVILIINMQQSNKMIIVQLVAWRITINLELL